MTVRSVQPLNTGATLSATVTVKAQLAVLPDKSVAEHVTEVTPLLKVEPDAGLQMTGRAPLQLSLAVGKKATCAEH